MHVLYRPFSQRDNKRRTNQFATGRGLYVWHSRPHAIHLPQLIPSNLETLDCRILISRRIVPLLPVAVLSRGWLQDKFKLLGDGNVPKVIGSERVPDAGRLLVDGYG